MAEPSSKSPQLDQLLDNMIGRTGAIKQNVCVDKPFGCGGPASDFRDPLSRKEYSISGLCQLCQDELFG